MTLEQAIAEWDGKSTKTIATAFETYGADESFADQLVALLEQAPLQKGASWLLKRWLEAGGQLSAETTQALFYRLPSLVHWETRLHLLQSLDHLTISSGQVDAVHRFIVQQLGAKKTFVRAWAYSGFYQLAKQHPQFRSEVDALFIKANAEESASVRARIRNATKQGG